MDKTSRRVASHPRWQIREVTCMFMATLLAECQFKPLSCSVAVHEEGGARGGAHFSVAAQSVTLTG